MIGIKTPFILHDSIPVYSLVILNHFKYVRLDISKMKIPAPCALETPINYQLEMKQAAQLHVMV